MISAEAIKLIQETAVSSASLVKVPFYNGTLLVDKHTREASVINEPVLPVHKKFVRLNDFYAYVVSRSNQYTEPGGVVAGDIKSSLVPILVGATDGAAVYVGDRGLDYREGITKYDNSASMDYIHTEGWIWLDKKSTDYMSQRDFVRLLKITLRREIGDSNLAAAVANISFTNNANGTSDVGTGRSSISRSITNEVRGINAIPETIVLTVAPYENVPFDAQIICAIEINETDQKFKLTPVPGEMFRCREDVLNRVVNMFGDEADLTVVRASV